MKIGVPKESKDQEYRVGLVPSSVRELVQRGHQVFVQQEAGFGAGFEDDEYIAAGAKILSTSAEIFATGELIVKVKELQKEEFSFLRTDQILFAFLHLAPDLVQTEHLLSSNCIAIAYETVTNVEGRLPLLMPMSEVAGRLSIQTGAHYLEKVHGGKGLLLGGVAGVTPGKVLILGGGIAGTQALRVAVGMGANVTIWDRSLERLRELDLLFSEKINTCYANTHSLEENLMAADLVIGALLIPGGTAPKVVTKALLKKMRPGSVVVDLSIDQGGCFESSRPTSHANPIYIEENVIHYCVTNIPAEVPRTASIALNNATLPFITSLADKGYKKACLDDPHLLQGLNVCKGHMTHPMVAQALQKPYTEPRSLLI